MVVGKGGFSGKLHPEGQLMTSLSFPVGHGRSDGERLMVSDFHVFVRDVLQHVDTMHKDYPGLPIFLLGHSMVSKQLETSSDDAWHPASWGHGVWCGLAFSPLRSTHPALRILGILELRTQASSCI